MFFPGATDTPCMTSLSTPALSEDFDSRIHERPWYGRFVNWIAEARSHRVICLVIGIWLFNVFDLALTLLAHQQGLLDEENPLARHMLENGTPSIVLFKVGLLMIGTYPLLRFRRARVTELGSYVILVAYALLAVHWRECYELYTITATNHVHVAEIGGLLGTGS